MNGCRNLARRTAISNLPVAIKFPKNCCELKSCPIMGLNLFQTLNRANSNKEKCYLNEKFALSCYYAACRGNFLGTFRKNLSVLS